MRRPLAVIVWVLATLGVTYVANAAVELVDLQVFPQGGRIRVLERVAPVVTTTVAPVVTTTVAPVVTTTTVAPVVTTTVAPVVTTTVAPVVTTTTVAPVVTTTVAPVVTTTTVAPVVTTTTVAPVVTTTVAPVVTTTVAPVVTTTTVAPVVTTTTTTVAPSLVMVDLILDDARAGSEYGTTLVAGGSALHSWEIVDGALPVGLVLADNGSLTGTPVQSGRYQFVARAVDASGRTGTADYFLTVKEFRVVSARGGSVTVVVQGDSVVFFSALQAEGFEQAVLVRSGPIVVEVQFLPASGDDTSWVKCEASDGVVCSHG